MNTDCWYWEEDTMYCLKGQNQEWCDENCPIYKNMKSNFEVSNLPRKYWYGFTLKKVKADAEEIDRILAIKSNLKNFVAEGKNVLLQSSKCGNGKTCFGIKLLQKQIELQYKGSANGWPPAFFIYVPDLLLKAREAISSRKNYFDNLKNVLENSSLVMFDDIGCINLKDYDMLVLSTILEKRFMAGLSSIFTTNLQDGALKEVLGERLYDRITKLSEIITFKSNSMRSVECQTN